MEFFKYNFPKLYEIYSVLSKKRNLKLLTYFLIINLLFMFVEVIYGLLSNSLGLLTDGAHMLLDCTAVVIGLYSSYLSEFKSNNNYNYGYLRSEILGTFINSVFLFFIAVYIVFESIERFIEPKDIDSENLILVSFLGLVVNIIGLIFAHDHGDHDHNHGEHDHNHGEHEHNHGHEREHHEKQLNDEKKELEDKYNNLFAQLEASLNANKDMKNEINEIKIKNLKYKTEYEDTLEKLINIEKRYNQELLQYKQKKAKEEEDLKKAENALDAFIKQQGIKNQNFDFSANKRKSQIITLPKNITLLEESNEEKLKKYVEELEKMNEVLTERNKDSTLKIKELEDIISKNANISKIVKKVDNPKKLNEIVKPSLYEIFNERICLII